MADDGSTEGVVGSEQDGNVIGNDFPINGNGQRGEWLRTDQCTQNLCALLIILRENIHVR